MKKTVCALLCVLLTFAVLSVGAFAEESKIKVACIGDSITNGSANFCEYPANLQKFLDGDKYEVKNFGFGGTTAIKNPDGVPSYWSVQQYEDSKTYLPDIVIIMLGTNDVVNKNWDLNNYKKDLTELVTVYQGLSSQPQVYLCTPTTAFDASHPQPLTDYAVPAVKEVAEATGATLVDVNARTADMGDYFDDGIHPNNEGYVKLAQIYYEDVFGGEVTELTIKADEGIKVLYGGQQKTMGSDDSLKVVTGNGKKTVKLEKPGVGFTYVEFTVDGVTLADCRGAAISENLAFSATATDKGGATDKPNDGDASTGWQRENGDGYGKDVWLQYDLGESKEISNMELEWEMTTRALKDGYTLTYSEDGNEWKSFSNISISYGASIDAVSFDRVTARYVKLMVNAGSHSKFCPSLFEWRVYNTEDSGFTVTVTYGEDGITSDSASSDDASSDSLSSDNGADGGKMPVGALIPIVAAAVIAVGLAVVMAVKKNKAN